MPNNATAARSARAIRWGSVQTLSHIWVGLGIVPAAVELGKEALPTLSR